MAPNFMTGTAGVSGLALRMTSATFRKSLAHARAQSRCVLAAQTPLHKLWQRLCHWGKCRILLGRSLDRRHWHRFSCKSGFFSLATTGGTDGCNERGIFPLGRHQSHARSLSAANKYAANRGNLNADTYQRLTFALTATSAGELSSILCFGPHMSLLSGVWRTLSCH
jgi:hypothetical protein